MSASATRSIDIKNDSATAAAIASIVATINTKDKYVGKIVHDTTNNRLMIAIGTTAGSNWVIVDGSASVTPA